MVKKWAIHMHLHLTTPLAFLFVIFPRNDMINIHFNLHYISDQKALSYHL